MSAFQKTRRTKVRRIPQNAVYDRASIDAILDEGLICHVGFVADGLPYVIPMGYARAGDKVYIHGSTASRLLTSLAGGVDVCLAVTLVDGLVLARSAFNHSMNYRSVVALGKAALVDAPEEKFEALRAFTEKILPGRWSDAVADALADPSVDIVFVTLPDYLHRHAAEQAFRGGKNVFLEKPIATTLRDADGLMEETARRGVQLYGAPNAVISPTFRAAAEAIGAGAGMASEYANTDQMGAYEVGSAKLSLSLRGLRIGDVVALADRNHRYGSGYRDGWLAFGVFGLVASLKGVLPALLVIAITEALNIRASLFYAAAGGLGLVGLYYGLGLASGEPDLLIRRDLEIMAGAGIAAGFMYWIIAGRKAGAWRRPRPPAETR